MHVSERCGIFTRGTLGRREVPDPAEGEPKTNPWVYSATTTEWKVPAKLTYEEEVYLAPPWAIQTHDNHMVRSQVIMEYVEDTLNAGS